MQERKAESPVGGRKLKEEKTRVTPILTKYYSVFTKKD